MNTRKLLHWFLVLALVGLVLIAACAKPSPAPAPAPTPAPAPAPAPTPAPTIKEAELKWATFAPPPMVCNWADSWLMHEMEEASGGKWKVTYYAAESLAKATEMFDAISVGRAHFGISSHGFTPGYFPLVSVLELPFLYPSSVTGSLVAEDMLRGGYLDKKLYTDVKTVGVMMTVPLLLWTKEPVTTMDDLKGLQIRVPGGAAVDMMESWGATGIAMPLPDVFSALEKGVIDGAIYEISNAEVFHYGEICKYYIDLPLYSTAVGCWMNKELWDSLPEDFQGKLDDLFHKWPTSWSINYELRNAEIEPGIIAKHGLQATKLAPAEVDKLKAATAHMAEDWIADVEAKGLPGQETYDALIRSLELNSLILHPTNRALK